MRSKPSRILLLGILLGLFGAAANGEELVAQGENVKVSLTTPDGQFEPGEVPFNIRVIDDQSNHVSNASVELFYGMAPQEGMPPMMYELEARKKGETWNAVLNVDMMGDWFIEVTVKRDGEASQTLKFEKHFMEAGAAHKHGHMHN